VGHGTLPQHEHAACLALNICEQRTCSPKAVGPSINRSRRPAVLLPWLRVAVVGQALLCGSRHAASSSVHASYACCSVCLLLRHHNTATAFPTVLVHVSDCEMDCKASLSSEPAHAGTRLHQHVFDWACSQQVCQGGPLGTGYIMLRLLCAGLEHAQW
jgi:hypothetical protein